MSKTTKRRNDWDAIRADYTNGVLFMEMAEKYNICHTQIARKAKKEGWLNERELVKTHDELAIKCSKAMNEYIETDPEAQILQKKIHNAVLPSQIVDVDKDIAMMALYKSQLMTTQQKFAKLVEKSTDQVARILDACVDGLYTNSDKADGSRTFDRTTRFLSDLAPYFAENNKALGMTTAQVAIQNNVNTNKNDDAVVQFYIPDNKRDK